MIALAASTAIAVFDLELLDDAMVCLPLFMIVIALALLAVSMRIVRSKRASSQVAADDPYFFAIGDAPTLPHQVFVGDVQRNESGGRGIPSPRSSAAVLTISKGERDV